MTKFGKIFAVFITAASLAFLGFTAVVLVGGPNWEAETAELPEFLFTKTLGTEGQPTTWTVATRGATPETVKQNSTILPEVIVAARKNLQQKQQAEIQRLDPQIPVLDAKIKEARELIEVDLKALKAREVELQSQLDAQHENIAAMQLEIIETAQAAERIRAEAATRREDVFRLRNQLAEIRTDKFRAEEQQQRLQDLLIRLRGTIDRLESREQQLQQAGAKPAYEDAPPAGQNPNNQPQNPVQDANT